MARKPLQSIPPEFGGVQSIPPGGATPQSFPKIGGGGPSAPVTQGPVAVPNRERLEAGGAAIRAREKRESFLMSTGLTAKQAQAQVQFENTTSSGVQRNVSVALSQQVAKGELSATGQLESQAAETPQGFLDQPIEVDPVTGEVIRTQGEGLANLATGAVIAGSIASLVASAGIALGTALTGNVIGVGGTTWFTKKFVAEAKASIIDTPVKYDMILAGVQDGTISPSQAFDLAADLENSLDMAERTGKIASANKVSNFLTGGKDILSDAKFARKKLENKRILLAQAISLAQAGATQEPRLPEQQPTQ